MLSIALPKGSLEEQTLLLFAEADLPVRKSSRAYDPTIDDPRITRVKVLRPQEIPIYVADGHFDLGIPVDVQFSYGATEAKVPELMDALVDLTETGSTLRQNGLRIVEVILESNTPSGSREYQRLRGKVADAYSVGKTVGSD